MEKNFLPDIYSNPTKSASKIPTTRIPNNNFIKTPQNNSLNQMNPSYKEAYEKVGYAKGMINDRLDKLNYEKSLLEGFRKPILGMHSGRMPGSYENFYDMQFLNAARNRMGRIPGSDFVRHGQNPYMYNAQQPLYYPLEMPVKGEPLKLPGMELGRPIQKEHKIGGLIGSKTGITMKDLMMILLAGNGQLNPMLFGNLLGGGNVPQLQTQPQPQPQPLQSQPNVPKPLNNILPLLKLPPRIIPDIGPRRSNKNLWQLVRNFTNMHKYYQIALKYSKNGKPRDAIIDEKTRQVLLDLDSLKAWLMEIQKNFFDELAVFEDLDLSFNKNRSNIELQENYQKICALLNVFIKTMYRLGKDGAIPEKIQGILYSYIKPKSIFPRKYLTTFEINRLDFFFYGGLREVTDSRAALIIAYLVISRAFIQTLLLHIKENFPQYSKHPMIFNNALLLGSILHYLTNSCFAKDPPFIKKVIGLMNYYRNHHLYNQEIEENQDLVRNIRQGTTDKDELKDSLMQDSEILKFIQDNNVYVERYKSYLQGWAMSVAKFMKQKYDGTGGGSSA